MLLNPSDSYMRASLIVQYRFCRPHVIVRSNTDNLMNEPQISSSNIDGLLKLTSEMPKCEITLSQLGFASNIDSLIMLYCEVSSSEL